METKITDITMYSQPEQAASIMNAIPAVPALLEQRQETISKATVFLTSLVTSAKAAFEAMANEPTDENIQCFLAIDAKLNTEIQRCANRMKEWTELRAPVTKWWNENIVTPVV